MNVKMLDVAAMPNAASPPQTNVSQPGDVGGSFQGALDSKIQNVQQPKNKVEEVKKEPESKSPETKTEASEPAKKEVQTEKKEATTDNSQQVNTSVLAMIMLQTQLQEASKKKQSTGANQKTTETTAKTAGVNVQNATKEAAVLQSTKAESPVVKEDKTAADVKNKPAAVNTSKAAETDASKEQSNLKTAKDSGVLDGKENVVEITENNKEVVVSAKEGLLVDTKGQVTPFSEVITTVQNKTTAQVSSVMTQVDTTIKDMMSEGTKIIRLQISPENLGKVDIKLISGADGMQVILTAEKQGTGKLLESNLSQLQQSLMDAGVTIGHMSVSQQNADKQQSWQEAQQNNSSSSYKTTLVSTGDNTTSSYVRSRSSMSAVELQA